MNRFARLLFLCALVFGSSALNFPAAFRFPTQTLTVPDGFEVQLVAGPGLVDRPITADFDEHGRLYVTESSGSNDKVDQQLISRPHRILRLEDTNGDGQFDRSVVFADKMMFPEGCLWFRGSLYVSAPPSIWKLTDTDGDGVADRREEWLQAKTLTGCANDLHGPHLGPDGWIYWCKGAFAEQTYERAGRPPFVTRAAHIFRARPDGTGIEPVLTGGMDNPVSVTFTAGGERILTGTFFVHPGGGHRDGLIHAIYGGVYGKDHDVINGHKRTGDLMPIMTHQGPSASCFVIRYQSGAFGMEYRDNLFACLFNLQKVTRHVLIPDGATFKTQDEDFLVSDNPDFHPTDVLEDADGSLLIVDTGGWYKICCPTSQLWKPDVLGAIYRVRRRGAPDLEDPRGQRINWETAQPRVLAGMLGDPRPAVRQRAIEMLAAAPSSALPALETALRTAASPEARCDAVWALTRIETFSARVAVRIALTDTSETVRQAALHSIAAWRDAGAVRDVLRCLETDTAPLQRTAAEALGRIGDPSAIPALLKGMSSQTDRVLEHSLIYALIEIADPEPIRQFLANPGASPHGQRAALIALDQMDNGGLQPNVITPLLSSLDPVLKQTASWIVRHHPEWASSLESFFRHRLRSPDLDAAGRAELELQLSDFARDEAIQQLIADVVSSSVVSDGSRISALRSMARARLKATPAQWIDAVAEVLRCNEPALAAAAVSTARALPLPKMGCADLVAELRRIGSDATRQTDVRLAALSAVPGGLSEVNPDLFEFVRSNLDETKPVVIRGMAAGILSQARLTDQQLRVLTDSIKTAGPMELPKLLGAFGKVASEPLGLNLVSALKHSAGLSALRPDTLKPFLTNFPETIQQAAEPLLALLNVDADQQRARLDELLAFVKEGDVRRGQAVFNSQKAACATCHAIGYLGGTVGPDLTRIGQVRTERDLLEAIVFPSASFVRSYEPVLVATKSGDDLSGVIREDGADELVLATGPGAEVRIARAEVAEMRPGAVSVMPGGLDEQLSRQELADLVAFLRATRW